MQQSEGRDPILTGARRRTRGGALTTGVSVGDPSPLLAREEHGDPRLLGKDISTLGLCLLGRRRRLCLVGGQFVFVGGAFGAVEGEVGHVLVATALELGDDVLGRGLGDEVVVEDEPLVGAAVGADPADVVAAVGRAALVGDEGEDLVLAGEVGGEAVLLEVGRRVQSGVTLGHGDRRGELVVDLVLVDLHRRGRLLRLGRRRLGRRRGRVVGLGLVVVVGVLRGLVDDDVELGAVLVAVELELGLERVGAVVEDVEGVGEGDGAHDLALDALVVVVVGRGLPEEAHELHAEVRRELGDALRLGPHGVPVEHVGPLLERALEPQLEALVQVVHLGRVAVAALDVAHELARFIRGPRHGGLGVALGAPQRLLELHPKQRVDRIDVSSGRPCR
mmetsp:Transcript_8250/g.33975  ORF Transcript_8250/g.33975 Transcript_8250/m.33975 type:complete len:391 (-) Transcript_8250:765-1937(-)